MAKRKHQYIVTIDADDFPGGNYNAEDIRKRLETFIKDIAGHYNPEVDTVTERGIV